MLQNAHSPSDPNAVGTFLTKTEDTPPRAKDIKTSTGRGTATKIGSTRTTGPAKVIKNGLATKATSTDTAGKTATKTDTEAKVTRINMAAKIDTATNSRITVTSKIDTATRVRVKAGATRVKVKGEATRGINPSSITRRIGLTATGPGRIFNQVRGADSKGTLGATRGAGVEDVWRRKAV